jgi:hypothetical protein
MGMKIKGEWLSRRIWIDGEEIFPDDSLKIINHSPDGFNWSYCGSGPSQLALAILMYAFKNDKFNKEKYSFYQDFKWDYVSKFPKDNFEIEIDIENWIESKWNKLVSK